MSEERNPGLQKATLSQFYEELVFSKTIQHSSQVSHMLFNIGTMYNDVIEIDLHTG